VSASSPRLASTTDVQERVRELAATGTAMRIVGRGTWLDAGRPVRADATLALDALTGIVEYVPGDLTLTARTGTSLAELQTAARAHGQWLPLDPWGGDTGSLGATLATATAGPSAGATGLPRDLVLGVEVVTGDGRVVRGGGRVVKNVAGFDLVRLMVGAWGTLGALTEATVRLRALPEVDATLAVSVALPLDELMPAVRRLQPVAAELLAPSLARHVGVGDATTLLVRTAGNAALVRARRRELAEIGDVVDAPTAAWERLRAVEPLGATVVRWSHLPGRLAESWRLAAHAGTLVEGTLAHASLLRGVVRAVLPTDDASRLDAALGVPFDGTTIYERQPATRWSAAAPSPVRGRLARGVRLAFDPHHLLNPGILGETA
jgi:glycolate oxidase FAD binding subunit